MNLYNYLNKNLTRQDPHPAIDFCIRAEKHQDGRISFYIHVDGRDSDTEDYWVEGNKLSEKRLAFEPLPESVRPKVLEVTAKFRAFWGYGNRNALCVPTHSNADYKTIADWIETVEGVKANYSGVESDDHFIFVPALGNRFTELMSLDKPIAAQQADAATGKTEGGK